MDFAKIRVTKINARPSLEEIDYILGITTVNYLKETASSAGFFEGIKRAIIGSYTGDSTENRVNFRAIIVTLLLFPSFS
jgi:hypothetical protein